MSDEIAWGIVKGFLYIVGGSLGIVLLIAIVMRAKDSLEANPLAWIAIFVLFTGLLIWEQYSTAKSSNQKAQTSPGPCGNAVECDTDDRAILAMPDNPAE